MKRINGSRGRGRPPKYVTDDMGNVVVGLSVDKSNGVFYNTHHKREGGKVTFGTDKVRAIQRYLQWRAGQGDKSITLSPSEFKEKNLRVIVDDGNEEYSYRLAELPENTIIQLCRQFLLDNPPHISAQKLGIPQLATMKERDIAHLKPSPTLVEIGNIYLDRKIKPLNKKQKMDSSTWWNDFCRIVAVGSIRDITTEIMQHYHETVHQERENNNYSPSWLKHRLDMVKTILRYAQKKMDGEDIERVIRYTNQFVYPQKTSPKPQPISKSNYRRLLANVKDNPKYKSMLLLSLNCAMYPIDISSVNIDDIDLGNGTLIMQRQKTGVLRVAVLWDETVEALRTYLNKRNDNSPSLFISQIGKAYKPLRLSKLFRQWTKKLGLSDTLCWEHIRDGAQTVGARAGIPLDTIRYLMGHKVSGITDHYLMRSPDLVRELCEVIRKHYLE